MGMDATLIAETEDLLRTAERLQRVGLVVDRSVFSRARRRAFFALQCQAAQEPDPTERDQSLIGFAYPNGDPRDSLSHHTPEDASS
jgi:hypothetical protein